MRDIIDSVLDAMVAVGADDFHPTKTKGLFMMTNKKQYICMVWVYDGSFERF